MPVHAGEREAGAYRVDGGSQLRRGAGVNGEHAKWQRAPSARPERSDSARAWRDGRAWGRRRRPRRLRRRRPSEACRQPEPRAGLSVTAGLQGRPGVRRAVPLSCSRGGSTRAGRTAWERSAPPKWQQCLTFGAPPRFDDRTHEPNPPTRAGHPMTQPLHRLHMHAEPSRRPPRHTGLLGAVERAHRRGRRLRRRTRRRDSARSPRPPALAPSTRSARARASPPTATTR